MTTEFGVINDSLNVEKLRPVFQNMTVTLELLFYCRLQFMFESYLHT